MIAAGASIDAKALNSMIFAFLSRPNITPRTAEIARVGLALIAIFSGDAPEAAENHSHLKSDLWTLEFDVILCSDRLLSHSLPVPYASL